MELGLFFCRFLNNFFPEIKRDFRSSPEAYAKTQYKWARISISYFNGYIDFSKKRVLDAGCSLGGKTLFFSELDPQSVIGIDNDSVRLKFAKKNAAAYKRNIDFIEASIHEMPFDTGSFDMIMMNDVVEHINISILKKALAECQRVLNKNGRLYLEFPPWQSHDASHLYDYIRIPWCQLIFNDKTLFKMIDNMSSVPTFGKSDTIEHYKELNRITIKEFNKIISELNFKIVLSDVRIIKNMKFLKHIPLLSKYFVTRAIFILSKY